ncbi:MAG: TrkH family potassium uptake protein [Bacteroidales bacterium]|jgi:trk system potassium uptake protein TrkH|nr:TrkH family potassium uptake protein [Bacteroidales bacterium]
MVNFRVIARVFSIVIIIEGLFMLLSAGVSILYGEKFSLLFASIITIVTGVLVFTPLRNEEKLTGQKEGYIIIAGIWIILSLIGTLPYLMSGSIRNFSDVFFESVSGFTTTGATILTNVESLSHGILFWRSITQWLGGLAFIIVSLSALQVVRNINIQLPLNDFTGQLGDRIHGKISESAKRLIAIYSVLTAVEAILLMLGGMSVFDAVCHSFSTISTGGFSTREEGIAAFDSPFILVVLTIFMFLAGTSTTTFYFALKKNFTRVKQNDEFVFYIITCLIFMVLGSSALWFTGLYPAGKSFLEGSFHAMSVISTTGFSHSDYNGWGNLMLLLIFIMMFTGGMSGSASSGLKIIRLLLITRNTRHEMRRVIHPNAYIPVRLDDRTVSQGIINNLLVYITIFFITICAGAFGISLMGYDIITSFSTSAAMLSNIGPGIGSFGPFSDYAGLPEAGKWFFSFLMLTGRLELFSILIFFTGSFYRR